MFCSTLSISLTIPIPSSLWHRLQPVLLLAPVRRDRDSDASLPLHLKIEKRVSHDVYRHSRAHSQQSGEEIDLQADREADGGRHCAADLQRQSDLRQVFHLCARLSSLHFPRGLCPFRMKSSPVLRMAHPSRVSCGGLKPSTSSQLCASTGSAQAQCKLPAGTGASFRNP